MCLLTWHHVLLRAKCFNIDFGCLRFLNQQAGLMFAFMCYVKQQKNPSLPAGESALKGVCCRISSSLKSQTHSEAVQLLWWWAQVSKAHKYKPALATAFEREKENTAATALQVPFSLVRWNCLDRGKWDKSLEWSQTWSLKDGTLLGQQPFALKNGNLESLRWHSCQHQESRKMTG